MTKPDGGGHGGSSGAGGSGGQGATGGGSGAGTGAGDADGADAGGSGGRDAADAALEATADLPADAAIDPPATGLDAPIELRPDLVGDWAESAVFVLGTAGMDCDAVCAALGKGCGGPGSVGLDCKVHTDVTACNDPGNWIYRFNPSAPPADCLGSWGTSDVCSNNYNTFNTFCCGCL